MYNEVRFAELTYVYTDGLAELLIKKQKDYGKGENCDENNLAQIDSK